MKSYKSFISTSAVKIAAARDAKSLQQAIVKAGGIDGIVETLMKMKREHEAIETPLPPAAVLAALVYHAPAKQNHSSARPNGISNLMWLRDNFSYALADTIASELNKNNIKLQDFVGMPEVSIKHVLDVWFSRPEAHTIMKSIYDKVQSMGGSNGN
jgi:hypothetical protein